jgi:hypothetical protein
VYAGVCRTHRTTQKYVDEMERLLLPPTNYQKFHCPCWWYVENDDDDDDDDDDEDSSIAREDDDDDDDGVSGNGTPGCG